MTSVPLIGTLRKTLTHCARSALAQPLGGTLVRRMHHCINGARLSLTARTNDNALLRPFVPTYNPVCGIKVKGRLELRCKDCYFVRRFDRLYVACKTQNRHKQAAMAKKPYKTWILTCAFQSPKRPWY